MGNLSANMSDAGNGGTQLPHVLIREECRVATENGLMCIRNDPAKTG
jgi:hypothetical protein